MKFTAWLALVWVVSAGASFDGEAPVPKDGDVLNSSVVGENVVELYVSPRRRAFVSPRRRAFVSPRRRAFVAPRRRAFVAPVAPRRRAMPVVSPRRRAAIPVAVSPRRRAMPAPAAFSPRRRMMPVAGSPRRRTMPAIGSPRRRLSPVIGSPRRRISPVIGSPRRRLSPVVAYPRRRTMIAGLRRRSSDWQTGNYYPRRRYAGSNINHLGFMSGITMGTAVGMGGTVYYYHQQGWHDNYGTWHPAGYYSPSGTYYNDPSYFGYSPRPGMPGYGQNYPPPYPPNRGSGGLGGFIIFLLIIACFCWCCCCGKSNNKSGEQPAQASEPLLADQPPQQSPQNCPVNTDDAVGWLTAARNEYVNREQGALGQWMTEVALNDQDQQTLDPYENRIRNAGDPGDEICRIADEWGVRP